MSNPSLPHDVLLEIFLRLPTKSVGKCRCLSKTWRTQLSTKHFINSHLKQQEQKLILVNRQSGSLHVAPLPLDKDEPLTDIQLEKKWVYVLGSCNGLVLLLEKGNESNIFVLNPITRQQVKIPPYPGSGFQIYGFGYDTSSDDFKVFKITWYYYSWKDLKRYAFVDVYYLKTSVWRRIDNAKVPFDLSSVGAANENLAMPLVNGAVHWAVMDTHKMNRILAFDLDKETFCEVQLPPQLIKTKNLCSLKVLKGCFLSIEHSFGDLSADVWVMKDYGVVDSWVRFRFVANVMERGIVPICFVGDGEFLCVDPYDRDCWTVCDLKDQGMAQKMVDGRIPFSAVGSSSCGVFVESLVSPEQGTISS